VVQYDRPIFDTIRLPRAASARKVATCRAFPKNISAARRRGISVSSFMAAHTLFGPAELLCQFCRCNGLDLDHDWSCEETRDALMINSAAI
jgi:hypothetical protein